MRAAPWGGRLVAWQSAGGDGGGDGGGAGAGALGRRSGGETSGVGWAPSTTEHGAEVGGEGWICACALETMTTPGGRRRWGVATARFLVGEAFAGGGAATGFLVGGALLGAGLCWGRGGGGPAAGTPWGSGLPRDAELTGASPGFGDVVRGSVTRGSSRDPI